MVRVAHLRGVDPDGAHDGLVVRRLRQQRPFVLKPWRYGSHVPVD